MKPIFFFLGTSFLFVVALALGFLFGYQIGKQEFHYENLKKSLSDFKKNTVRAFTPRQKVVILNSKDSYLPEEEDSNDQ